MSRNKMVDTQIEARGITSMPVLNACRKVRRDLFVPVPLTSVAYADFPLPIGCGQTISQPYIVALMTELLNVGPESRVLEIGTGSGYQTAILSELVHEVFTMEIIPDLAIRARHNLEKAGYGANIHFKTGNGACGWLEFAPYDGIIVTAAAMMIPDDLRQQLKPGGVMVIPVGRPDEVQTLYVVHRTVDGFWEEPNIQVRFVPLTGGLC